MIEMVDAWKDGTFEAHTEGGGDPALLLFRIHRRHEQVIPPAHGRRETLITQPASLDVVIDKDDARALFNWLGVWLHQV